MHINDWNKPYSLTQLDERYALLRHLADSSYERAVRRYWESRTLDQLAVLAHQAWQIADQDQARMAATYFVTLTGALARAARANAAESAA